jgi:peptidyl-prolyl cis-trans isomerase D
VLQGIEHIEAGVKSLESVRPELEEGLRAELAQQLAYEKALDAYNMNRKGAGMVGAAQQLGLAPLATELFSQQQPLAVFGDQPELQRLAFEAEVGSLLPPQRVGGAVYLCQVAERLPSEIPPLEQVQEPLRQALRRERAMELARQAGEKALQAVREGAALQQVLPAGTKLEETGLFSRSLGDFVPKIGQQAQLAEAAFRLTPEQPLASELYAQADQYYLVCLKQLEVADPTRLSAEEAERLRAQVLTRRQEEAVSQTLEQLRQSATIVIADAIVRAIQQGE